MLARPDEGVRAYVFRLRGGCPIWRLL